MFCRQRIEMRIGIDLGGTKIEGIVMGEGSRIVARQRISTPAGNYEATLDALCGLAKRLEAAAAVGELPIGVGSPGALSKTSGLMKNCSSTCLHGKRSEEHTSELQSLMRSSYAVFCLTQDKAPLK